MSVNVETESKVFLKKTILKNFTLNSKKKVNITILKQNEYSSN